MPGYEVITAQGANSDLVCPECGLILKDAVQTSDGIRLCESCYKDIESEANHTSKKTGITVVADDGKPLCFPDRAVRREVNNLEVRCNNCRLGCKWAGQLMKYLETHEAHCLFKPYPCPRCNKQVLKDDLKQHLASECQKRSVSCEHCRKGVVYEELQKHHKESCGKFPLLCEHCGQEVTRDKMGDHKLIECKVMLCTCGELLNRNTHEDDPKSVTSHLKNPAVLLMHLLTMISMLRNEVKESSVKHDTEIKNLKSQLEHRTQQLSCLEYKYEDMERQVTRLKIHVSEMELQLQSSLASTYSGSFIWRIPDIKKHERDAIDGQVSSLYSPPFYTAKNGYKMCIRLYLNGDGMGHKTHLSIFFVLMKGEFDALLKWPFDHKISMILVDQNHRRHIYQTFKPTPESSSFQRPISDMNVASGCPQFCKLSVLDDENYTKDDVLFIKCIVDTSYFCSDPGNGNEY